MSESQDGRPAVLRFGPFQLNVQSGELWSGETRVRLNDRPLQVLTLLLQRQGEVVTRDELRARVWQGTVVDFDLGLTAAINRLREVLGDEAEAPVFIETLPRRGYRFIAPVEPVEPAVKSEEPQALRYHRHVVYASPDVATREAPRDGSGSASSSSAEWENLPLPPETTRYTLLEKIGSGGMGEVFRARDSRLGREVAIKFLPEWLAEDAKAMRRFEREAQAAAALNHPNMTWPSSTAGRAS
jgi:DNA-binding winged helix-turn-helix (wHTH) protein